jgi:hypothetical protein
MAGFSSQDSMINEITTNGKFFRSDWNKLFNPTAAAVAGEWHSMARGAGNPPADSIFNTGTALLQQQVFDITTNAGAMPHGGNVGATGADFKVALNAAAFSAAATTMPAVLMLVDILAFYRVTPATTITAQNTINSNTFTASSSSGLLLTYTNDFNNLSKVRFTTTTTLPTGLSLNTDYWLIRVSSTTARVATTYANAIAGTAIAFTDAGTGTHTVTLRLPRYSDGAGVQAFMFNSNATALGAGTPNLTLPSYTNSAGTASRVTPAAPSPPIGKTAATNSHILYSGATGAGKFGPFLPLQSGDAGIQSIQQIQQSATYTSGEYSVAMCKPILDIPLTTLGVAGEREFASQLPSFPRVFDGAALYWLLYSGAATPPNSAFYGRVDFGWA